MVSVSASSSSNYLNIIFVCVFWDLVEMNGLNGWTQSLMTIHHKWVLNMLCMLHVTRNIFTNVATETNEVDETDLVRLPDNNLYPVTHFSRFSQSWMETSRKRFVVCFKPDVLFCSGFEAIKGNMKVKINSLQRFMMNRLKPN